jgi:hypothetical protein
VTRAFTVRRTVVLVCALALSMLVGGHAGSPPRGPGQAAVAATFAAGDWIGDLCLSDETRSGRDEDRRCPDCTVAKGLGPAAMPFVAPPATRADRVVPSVAERPVRDGTEAKQPRGPPVRRIA